MITGIGNDIIEIKRIRDNLERYGQRFLDRIFTAEEQHYCLHFKDPAPHLAGRFAAKEAISKALGVGIGAELSWLDISIGKSAKGAPVVVLSTEAKLRFQNPQILLSISHCKEYATAIAILT